MKETCPSIAKAKDLLSDEKLKNLFMNKMNIQTVEEIIEAYKTKRIYRRPIIVIGDIQGDIKIFERIEKLCVKLNIPNLFDPSKTTLNEIRNLDFEKLWNRYRKEKHNITFVVLGDIVGDLGKNGWNKYIFSLFVLAEILHPENVYLLKGCQEEKILESLGYDVTSGLREELKLCCNKMPYALFNEANFGNRKSILFSHKGLIKGLLSIQNLTVKQRDILVNGETKGETVQLTSSHESEIIKMDRIRLWISSGHNRQHVIS